MDGIQNYLKYLKRLKEQFDMISGSRRRLIKKVKEYQFTLTVPSDKTVSCAIWKDNKQVRNLFGLEKYTSGKYVIEWDGKDDAGNALPVGDYEVRYQTNNVTWQHLGGIGNTSINEPVGNQHHSHDVIQDMVVVDNFAIYCVAYNESACSTWKFNIANPQSRTQVLTKGAASRIMCTDGNLIYFSGEDPFNKYKTFCYAVHASTFAEHVFSAGVFMDIRYGQDYQKVVSYKDTTPVTGAKDNPPASDSNVRLGEITGMAVQPTGNFLFIARNYSNKIHVHHKTTGASITEIDFTAPGRMDCDVDNNLWVISGETVKKYPINVDGTLGTSTLTLSGLQAPMSVRFNNNKIVIADAGSSQQVKAFNYSTGAADWTLGDAGGYQSNSDVTNYKFFFTSNYQGLKTFVAFQPDGSFWVGDPGNHRIQKYNSSRVYVDRVAYIIKSYSCRVDPTTPTRWFSHYMEKSVTYPNPQNGWQLVKNWGGTLPPGEDNDYYRLYNLATLSNGRTYALTFSPGFYKLIELTPEGVIRFTGDQWSNTDSSSYINLYPDGSIRRTTRWQSGVTTKFYMRTLTGFVNNNPTWGSEVQIAATPAQTLATPGFHGNRLYLNACEKLDNGTIAVYDHQGYNVATVNGVSAEKGLGNHLGLINAGNNSSWVALGFPATHKSYSGDYPENAFDVGNNSRGGNIMRTLGNFIICGYSGEFWKNTQTNKYHWFTHDLLPLFTMGWAGNDAVDIGNAGNAWSWNVFADPLDATKAYITHNDESQQGIMHVWHISGLNTIERFTKTITITKPEFEIPKKYIDLLDSVPVTYQGLPGGVRGRWTFPAQPVEKFDIRSARITFGKRDKSIYFFQRIAASPFTGTNVVTCDINNAATLTKWKLNGFVNFDRHSANDGTNGGLYWEILDNTGKAIFRFYFDKPSSSITTIRINTTTIYSDTEANVRSFYSWHHQPFEFACIDNILSFKYADFNPVIVSVFTVGADKLLPTQMKITLFANNSAANRDRAIAIKNPRFYKNSNV